MKDEISNQTVIKVTKTLGLAAVLVGGSYLLYKKVWKKRSDDEPLTISEINLYPVKSLRGMSVKQWTIGERGLLYDRQWMIVTQNTTDVAQYKFITQRQYPKLCKIGAIVNPDDLTLTLYSVDNESDQFVLKFKHEEQNASRVTAEIWNKVFEALDMGDSVADWLSSHLQKDVRLVMAPEDLQRQPHPVLYKDVNGDSTDVLLAVSTGFVDDFPHLIVTENSLADVNKRLPNRVQTNRFRPNITVKYNEGLHAFEEEYWRHIEIVPGEANQRRTLEDHVQLYHANVCIRCSVPNVNPDTAEREQQGPSYQLNRYHTAKNLDDYPIFGLNAMHTKGSVSRTVRVGDLVVVHSKYSVPPVFIDE